MDEVFFFEAINHKRMEEDILIKRHDLLSIFFGLRCFEFTKDEINIAQVDPYLFLNTILENSFDSKFMEGINYLTMSKTKSMTYFQVYNDLAYAIPFWISKFKKIYNVKIDSFEVVEAIAYFTFKKNFPLFWKIRELFLISLNEIKPTTNQKEKNLIIHIAKTFISRGLLPTIILIVLHRIGYW
jgi:hypothetical protein